MRTLFAVLAIGLMSVATTGCKNKDHHDGRDTQKMSADACSHCAGVQTATAAGTCPKCGMKVK
jgi:uncharacterized paraquat-inducible protein A